MKIKIIFTKILLLSVVFFISQNIFSQKANLNIGTIDSKNYFEEINFEFVKQKIIIPVVIQGKTYKFLLDTGAPNIISKEIYELTNSKTINKIPIRDVSGKKEYLEVVLLKNLKLGNTTFKNTACLVHDIKANPIFKCFGVDGFIGSNMLRKSILQIDLKKQQLIITNSKKNLNLNKKNASKIKLRDPQSSPYLEIKLIGKANGNEKVLLDTGMDGLYDIALGNYEVFKPHQIFTEIGESKGASSLGLFGDAPVNNHFRLHLEKMRINNFEIDNLVTNTTNDGNSKIGAELLQYGLYTIDYKNKKFYFNAKERIINVEKPLLGFSKTLKDSQVIIGFVWDKTLKSKLNYGDEIIEINGINIDSLEMCDLIIKEWDSNQETSVQIKVKSKEGVLTELTIKKNIPIIKTP